MEAKCKTCNEWFGSSLIFVTASGIFCKDCVPEDAEPMPFTFFFSWRGINALMDYIDGERNLDVIEVVDTMRSAMGRKIITQIRGLINGGEVRESNPQPMDSGDAES